MKICVQTAPQTRPERAQDLHREQLGLRDMAMRPPMHTMQRAGHPESAAAVPLVYFLLKRQGYRRFLAASNVSILGGEEGGKYFKLQRC